MKPKIVHILGGPGCGKGTQSLKLATKYNFKHLSAGELLRQEQNRSDSQYSQLISGLIKEGKIVPDFITSNLLVNSITSENKTVTSISNFYEVFMLFCLKNKFLIDGYPRNAENLKGWMAITKSQNLEIQALLFFQCSKETMWQRIQVRSNSSGREDDNRQSFIKRLDTFYEHTMKVKDYFENQGKCITVNAEDTADNIFLDIETKLNFLLK